jgi:hypothetical protein
MRKIKQVSLEYKNQEKDVTQIRNKRQSEKIRLLSIYFLIGAKIMHWILDCLIVLVLTLEAHSSDGRIGPCPGIPLDSCECFRLLYDRSLDISNMSDIVSRNWQITLMYQDLSHSFQTLLRVAPNSTTEFPAIAVWPSVAAWASNDVGFNIRQQGISELWAYVIEKLPQWMRDMITQLPAVLVNVLLKEILQNAAVALGQGNLVVFEQISLAFVQYGLEFCGNVTMPDDAKMAKFLEEYVCTGGKCDLANGLWSLYQAHSRTTDSMSFSELDQLLLIQGLYVGLEEQTRLQLYINESLPGYMVQWCRFWPATNLTKCREFLNKIATELLVHLFIGSHRLNTDQDVPSGIHNESDFSPFLTKLTNPKAYNLEEEEEEYPCLTATFQCGVLSEDSFVSPIFFLQLLLAAALDRRPA